MNEHKMSARPAGAVHKESRGFTIDQLEREISKALTRYMEPFDYDELCRIDGQTKVRAVRSEGRIDIFATFLKARRAHSAGGGSQL